MIGAEVDAVRAVVVDYLEGMIWGRMERVERAFHPKAIQVGHFAGVYEFLSRQEFIDWLRTTAATPEGSPYVAELLSVEVTGSVAVVKVSNTCFGSDFTDWLVLVKDGERWQIVTKAFVAHSGTEAG